MRRLTKANIEELAKEVKDWALKNKLGKDWSLFYNGKKLSYPLKKGADGMWDYKRTYQIEEANPLDYSVYFPDHFIMGMSYDGTMYEVMNGYYGDLFMEKLDKILRKYGLYVDFLDSCHSHFYEANDDMEVEYTIFEREKEYVLYGPERCEERWTYVKSTYPSELDGVMALWTEYSRILGKHEGACIIGEGISFNYKGNKYKMHNQSIYQGDEHFLKGAEYAKKLLEKLGATDIWIDHGRLD